ncbi:MAG: hypothetical protein HRU70_11400 [Phycisphaeraceae bacterium]|nr:MAG: hypothetical protein HRU70_11400 [Phycisphaeraceae bacterium]
MSTLRPILAWVLAATIAMWSPICLCQSHAGAGGHHRNARDHHQDGRTQPKSHGCAHNCGGEKTPGEEPKPSDDQHRCDCPQMVAALSTVEHGAQATAIAVLIPSTWVVVEILPPVSAQPMRRPADHAIKRPVTSLLRQHCALIV